MYEALHVDVEMEIQVSTVQKKKSKPPQNSLIVVSNAITDGRCDIIVPVTSFLVR